MQYDEMVGVSKALDYNCLFEQKYYHLSIRTSILVIESCLADEQCWHCNTNSSCDIYVLQSHFQDWVQRAEYLLNETTAVHLKK